MAILMLVASSVGIIVSSQPASANYPNGDCDSNAVLRCGVNGVSELKQKYRGNQGGDTKAIFSHFGMKSEAAFDGMVRGRVTKSGEIWVGNKKVATGAVTAGRHRMGADEVKVPGANAYMRPPSRSFRSNSLEALVKLNSRGEFVYGVIMSCGNPVQAQNKIKFPAPKPPAPAPKPPAPKPPAPKPQPKPEPKPQPKYSCDLLSVQTGGADRSVTASVVVTAENGATVKYVTYFWGDGTSTTTTSTSAPHQYDSAGTYSITATVRFTANGKEVTHTSQACKKSVTFKDQKPPEEPKNPKLNITKDVRLEGETTWEPELVESEPGGQLEYRITVTNTGEADLENVVIQDSLPSGLNFDENQILQGSVKVTDKTVADLIGDGVTVSSIAPGKSIVISFDVTVKESTDACEEPLRNVATANADDVPQDKDDAFVKVCQPEEPEQPEEPQVQGEQTPPPSGKLPDTGAAGAIGVFSATSFLGVATYRLKEFYSIILRR